MFKTKRRLLRGRPDQVCELPEQLLACEQIRRLMDRERMRSDRNSIPFSLLTFTFANRLDATDLAAIARVFHRRLRLTDDAGLLDPARVAVLLPDTPADGAWKLADDLLRLLHDLPTPECRVYVYPVDEANWDSTQWDDTQVSAAERSKAARGAANGSSKRHVTQAPSACVQPMRAFFIDRLPPWKRAVDLALACSALIVMLPLLLLIALIVKLSSRGPICYCQTRDGHAGRTFSIYKFRTMVVNADALKSELQSINEQDGPAFKLKNDPRVTTFGRFLRRTCLDEIPQLFNVIKGEMSIVGPRPMCSKEAKECTQWQRRRLDVTPGLTCIWQVHGGTKATFAEWMRMDLHYARSRSLIKDLRLIALTIPAIVRRDGVY